VTYAQDKLEYKGVPIGRVTARAMQPYYAGDSLTVQQPITATPGQPFQFLVSGHVSTSHETLYVFTATEPCLHSAQEEAKAALASTALSPGAAEYLLRPGPYNATTTSNPLTANGYICAYLQGGRWKRRHLPIGPVLEAGFVPVTVT
jgi:hypothetical protein